MRPSGRGDPIRTKCGTAPRGAELGRNLRIGSMGRCLRYCEELDWCI